MRLCLTGARTQVTGLVSHTKAPAVLHVGLAMAEREELERQAIQCRRLAGSTTDEMAIEALSKLADELEARISDIDIRNHSRA